MRNFERLFISAVLDYDLPEVPEEIIASLLGEIYSTKEWKMETQRTVNRVFGLFGTQNHKSIRIGFRVLEALLKFSLSTEFAHAWAISQTKFIALGVELLADINSFYATLGEDDEDQDENPEELMR